MTPFRRPDWSPRLEPGTRILVAGATGGLGRALVAMLLEASPGITIGAHGASKQFDSADSRVMPLVRPFAGEADCIGLVDEFAARAGGIDALVCLSGAIHFSGHWKDMPEADWRRDMAVNLDQPFFLARAAMARMKAQGTGGRILLNGTESALHGGSAMSMPYAIAKRGTECMVQGLAREGAPHDILVNGVRLGFIASGFHQRWHDKTPEDMEQRAALVPLKRGGDPAEAAALMIWMLGPWSRFVTGQMFALTGGDWL
ncbi:SDR family NAD(P)-dependent oxidoreductase [Magnetospirillum sp. UT-4]|uniref:SDR family NAD(P)-dependent oxidoreductase n=1 Tax=Magnetospirillum sp. UT-4 TaxID=2681467 RepID=UPI00137E2D99|nr:SDR family oxidoreductase [Magnetospirillum sp. UT-4]CAA7621811.1 putative Short-chain dehydrogenase/reductase SDR [Magnetospirillum sp. UT-4]